MSANFYELLKYAATGQASPDMTYYDRMRASTLMGGVVKTLTGIPPLSFPSDGSPITVWSMKGNGQQTGTPSPQSIIMPTFCGVRTGNLWDKGVPLYVYTKDYKKYNADNSIKLKAGTYTISSDGRIPTIQAFDDNNDHIVPISDAISYGVQYYIQWDNYAIGPTSDAVRNATITLLRDCTLTFAVTANIGTYIMLNLGSTALPYEPYGWAEKITCGGENLFDLSTVTNNRYVSNSNGELVYYSGGSLCGSDYIDISGAAYVSITAQGGNEWGAFYDAEKAFISGISGYTNKMQIPDNAKYMRLTVKTSAFDSFMVNLGSTAMPFAPYSRQTVPVYLGEVPTVRRVRKLVLTGTSADGEWKASQTRTGSFYLNVGLNGIVGLALCDRATNAGQAIANYNYGNVFVERSGSGVLINLWLFNTAITLNDFKAYLAQQYAAGTPVTIWYVLATPETGITNEPLCKIGTYADELHSADAAVTIPTAKGSNTLTVDTPIQPSEMSITYKG